MKRPPGLWILLSAGVLWLCLRNVHGLRATALIFGKSTTTTTTTTSTEAAAASEEELATTEPNAADANDTKPTLTGVPQIDYVWDPNLPKELNGYNLSDYPFYERVPEDIDFKCDGLHDGFYASVAHKCQVYHHCLFGTRYDFLCANYTAFDQTLFNCNFVSNVDCANSKKFWHRNDDLYIDKSTTTAAPVIYNFYTSTRPRGVPLTASPHHVPPSDLAGVPALAPAPIEPNPPRRRVRPATRRRPQYDYYDDEDYDELPRSRRKRPRPRPVYYDDDYEEYDDDRFERRGGGRRRRPYDRRPVRRDKDRRRKYDYDDVDDPIEDEDFTLGKKQKGGKRRKYIDDYDYEDDRRDRYDKRRTQNRREDKPPRKSNKRPTDEDYDYDYVDRLDRRKTKEDKRRLFSDTEEDTKKIPRLGKRRPPSEDYEDDLQQADDPRSYNRARKSNKESSYKKIPEETRTIIKPASGTLYDRPRVAPKINLPVPKNAAEKFAYKSIATHAPVTKLEEDYDDYEESSSKRSSSSSRPTSKNLYEDDYSDSSTRSYKRQKDRDLTTASGGRKRPTADQNEQSSEENFSKIQRPLRKNVAKPTSTAITTTESATEHPNPIIRKFKRPFLPSRGGNPYSARSLQPVGAKTKINETEQTALKEQSETSSNADSDYYDKIDDEEIQEGKPDVVPVPVRVKSPLLPSDISTYSENLEDKKDLISESKPPLRIKVPIRMKSVTAEPGDLRSGISTTIHPRPQQVKLETDVLNANYDVTLNEAISPVLPNLPVRRNFPTSLTGSNDYAYTRSQRPIKYVILDPLVRAGNTYYVK